MTASGAGLNIGVFGVRGIPSTYSGYETFLTELLPELAERGHRVTVYCRRDIESTVSGPYRGVRRRWLPSIGTKQLDTLSHGAVSAGVAAASRHDVVLVCNIANVPFCAAIERTGTPVVLNTDGQEWLRGKWGEAARWYFRQCAKRAGRAATALVSDCNAMRGVYLREFDSDTSVIPYCWNSVGSGPTDSADPAALATFGLQEGLYFITGGRMVPENNIDRIAEQYSATAHGEPLAVLGKANYNSPVSARLDQLAERDDRIRLVGHVVERAEFRALLAGASAYLHGHSVGGMNPSLVEAMGCGAVVGALDTPFNREVLGSDGLYFDLEPNGRGLAGLLDDLAEDQAWRRSANAQRAREEFDLRDVAGAYESLLHVAAAAQRGTKVRVTTRWEANPHTGDRSALPEMGAPRALFVAASAEEYGSDRMLLESVRALSPSVEPVVLLPFDGPLRTKLQQAGARCIVLDDYGLRRRYMTLRCTSGLIARNLRAYRAIRNEHRSRPFSVIYSNTQAVIVGAIAARRLGIPHVWHVHELLTDPRWVAMALARAAQSSDRVITCSSAARDHIVSLAPASASKVMVVPNGIEDPGPVDRRHGTGIVRIGCVGGLHPTKGQGLLLEAAASLRGRASDLDFSVEVFGSAFAGNESVEQGLHARARSLGLRDTVTFHGYVDDPDQIYEKIDLVVVPSTSPEGFGLVCLEAQARCIPVVAADEGGPTETVVDGVSGVLFRARDSDALAHALEELIRSPEIRARFGSAGRANFVDRFTLERYRRDLRAAVLPVLVSTSSSRRGL